MRTLRAVVALGLVALTVTPVEPNPNVRAAETPHYAGPTSRIDWPEIGRVARWVASVAAEPPRTPPPPRVKQRRVSVSSGDAWECIRSKESGGDYTAVGKGPARGHWGAYQFSQQTWDATAARHGREDLIGVRPDQASAADQDQMARWLQSDSGWSPWATRGACGL